MADFSLFYFHPETATVLALVAARTNPKTKLLTPVGVQLARKKAFLSGFVDVRAGKSFWTLKNFGTISVRAAAAPPTAAWCVELTVREWPSCPTVGLRGTRRWRPLSTKNK